MGLLLSAAQARELDRLAIEQHGIAGARLMSNAGTAVAHLIEREYPHALSGTIGILCGGGNNGGDGLVIARWLSERQVRVRTLVFAPQERLRGDAAGALGQLRAQAGARSEPVFLSGAEAWEAQRKAVLECDLLVDALFGTGLVQSVRTWLGSVITDLNRNYRGPVVAVDIPSGMGADGEGPAEASDAPVLRAERTVTFATAKRGQFLSRHAGCVGRLEVVPIGIPSELLAKTPGALELASAELCEPFLQPRAPDAHKGRFGHVLVIAGSRGKSGAAVLASTAALRIGAGLVTAAVPSSILPIVAAAQAEIMTEPLPETEDGRLHAGAVAPERLQELLDPATVLALGPGVTQAPESAELVRIVAQTAALPVVLDADGLNAFDGRRSQLHLPSGGVLTPHPGEMGRLFGVSTATVQARRLYYACRLAAETGAVTVLKGRFSVIADADGRVFVNPSGNPGMATAGSGDVLTGMLAGLIAQFPNAPRVELIAAGVYLHGLAGDLAARREGEMPLLAGDLLAELPAALQTAYAATAPSSPARRPC